MSSDFVPPPATGIYKIKNVKTGLMLDLSGNLPREGGVIQVYPDNNTTAQRWIVRYQRQKGETNPRFDTVTIQSYNNTANGNGFFAPGTGKVASGEEIHYTRMAWSCNLVDGNDDVFRISYNKGKDLLVLGVQSTTDTEVRLVERAHGDARQQWQFIAV